MDVDGHDLRDLRGARRLLPPRRRLDRAPVRGGVRQRRSARRRARRRPRRRAAADQHPARRPRGRRARAHLPAGGGSRALRRAERRRRSAALVAFEAARAREWYARGLELTRMLDRRSAACVLAMSGIYRRLLERIEADPAAILERRVALGPWTKVGVAARSLLGGAAVNVVVVGGGVAGIVAALDCAAAGASVTLVEVRPRLGGAAYSVRARRSCGSTTASTCSCAAARPTASCSRRSAARRSSSCSRASRSPCSPRVAPTASLRRSGARPPLHLARCAAALPPPVAARADLAPGAPRSPSAALRPDDSRTLGDWLAEHGQSPHAIAALWDLIALPTLNLPAAEASLALGAFVFQQGLLRDAARRRHRPAPRAAAADHRRPGRARALAARRRRPSTCAGAVERDHDDRRALRRRRRRRPGSAPTR